MVERYMLILFSETYDALVAEVETLKGKDPENY